MTAPRLFLIGPGWAVDDPADLIAAVRPALAARYGPPVSAGPGGALSLRGLRRAFRPGLDRALYDFTRPDVMGWALDEPGATPGLILIGAEGWPAPHGAPPFAAARRYLSRLNPFPASARIALVDVVANSRAPVIHRPLLAGAKVQQAHPGVAILCGLGAVGSAWPLLRAFAARKAAAHIVTRSDADAARARAHLRLLGAEGRIGVEVAQDRPARMRRAAATARVIEVDDALWPGVSDAEFAARRAGCEYLRWRPGMAADLAFAAFPPAPAFAAGRAPEAAAAALIAAIERGCALRGARQAA